MPRMGHVLKRCRRLTQIVRGDRQRRQRSLLNQRAQLSQQYPWLKLAADGTLSWVPPPGTAGQFRLMVMANGKLQTYFLTIEEGALGAALRGADDPRDGEDHARQPEGPVETAFDLCLSKSLLA